MEHADATTSRDDRSLRVGFVGLGSQGAPMAVMLERAGWPLTVWARRPASLEPLQETSAAVAGDLVELGRASDILGVCVVNDDGVDEVCDAALGDMAEGSVVIVHSTV